jgi:hypothetical protein
LHENGWRISGRILASSWHYDVVREFDANHESFGRVWGDTSKIVYATDEKAFEEFVRHFPFLMFNVLCN